MFSNVLSSVCTWNAGAESRILQRWRFAPPSNCGFRCPLLGSGLVFEPTPNLPPPPGMTAPDPEGSKSGYRLLTLM